MAQLNDGSDMAPWWTNVGKVQPQAPVTAPSGSSGGGVAIPDYGSGGGGGGGTGGFSGGGPAYPTFNFGPVPQFNVQAFNAPTMDDATKDPGYMFRLKSGSDALEKSAAARGVLRTGGTLKDLMQYGQNFATQEYANVYDRALKKYNSYYQAQKDAYQPMFAEWQMQANAERAAKMAQYQNQWGAAMSSGGGGGMPPGPMPEAPIDPSSFGSFNNSGSGGAPVYSPGGPIGKMR